MESIRNTESSYDVVYKADNLFNGANHSTDAVATMNNNGVNDNKYDGFVAALGDWTENKVGTTTSHG